MFNNPKLSSEYLQIIKETETIIRDIGLDPYETIFELVDYKQLNEIAAYGGFPSRYPHWRWGMEYERLSKHYTYGLSVIYEMVINNDPCYAYLLQSNNMTTQKTVIAHVFSHCDFFKHNNWFKSTNRKMLDQMANHATTIKKIINKIGYETVENFIDTCLSLENLINIHSPFFSETETKKEKTLEPITSKSKPYMDNYINKTQTTKKNTLQTQSNETRPPTEQDILGFLVKYAPLTSWQRKVLSIIRDEACYFAPQGQTKILNEGWATYWHSKIMTEISPLKSSEIIDYCDQYSGVVHNNPMQLNPYKLGLELLRHIEHRWDNGKFGIEYLNCKDYSKKKNWHHNTKLGKEKIFEVRNIHNDLTFIDEFFDEEFCHKSKLFIYNKDPRTGKNIITSKDFKKIKERLLLDLTNLGQPTIKIINSNYKNRKELLLKDTNDHNRELRSDYAMETLKQLYKIWQHPVHLITSVEKIPKQITFDGKQFSIEKQ